MNIKLAFIVFVTFVFVGTTANAQTWTPPTQQPPSGNTNGPVWLYSTAPSTAQTGAGNFWVSGLGRSGNFRSTGYITAGTNATIGTYANIGSYLNVNNGDVKINNGDLYVTSTKAIRVDEVGPTVLWMGNYKAGGTGFTLNVQGDLNVNGHGSNLGTLSSAEICLDGDCRTSWPTATVVDQWVNTTGDSMTGPLSINSADTNGSLTVFNSSPQAGTRAVRITKSGNEDGAGLYVLSNTTAIEAKTTGTSTAAISAESDTGIGVVGSSQGLGYSGGFFTGTNGADGSLSKTATGKYGASGGYGNGCDLEGCHYGWLGVSDAGGEFFYNRTSKIKLATELNSIEASSTISVKTNAGIEGISVDLTGPGSTGIRASGTYAGGVFVNKDVNTYLATHDGVATNGFLRVAVPAQIPGSFAAEIQSGDESSGSGWGRVVIGNGWGVDAVGSYIAGSFNHQSNGGSAYLGQFDTGISAYGTGVGGYFRDSNNSGYARVGSGDRGIQGYGNFAGATFQNASDTTKWVDLGRQDYGLVVSGNTSLNGSVFSNGTLSMQDYELQNVKALQLKDWDDDTGGTDSKYRLLARDGAFQFYNGGVVVGNYPDGTWPDLADGNLVVERELMVQNASGMTTHFNFNNTNANYIRGASTQIDTPLTVNNSTILNGNLAVVGAGYPNSFINIQGTGITDAGLRLYEAGQPRWHIFNFASAGGYTSGDGTLRITTDNTYNPYGDVEITAETTNVYGNFYARTAAFKPGGGDWSTISDIRLKDVKRSYSRGLEAISTITPFEYSYVVNNPYNYDSSSNYIGVAAQQIQKSIPEAVTSDKDSGYLQMNNEPIFWAAINAIKELKSENDALRSELNDLKSRIEALEKK